MRGSPEKMIQAVLLHNNIIQKAKYQVDGGDGVDGIWTCS